MYRSMFGTFDSFGPRRLQVCLGTLNYLCNENMDEVMMVKVHAISECIVARVIFIFFPTTVYI